MKKILTISFCLFVSFTFLSGQELLTNGNFETGNFAPWVVTDAGTGSFFLVPPDGSPLPISFLASEVNATGGSWNAVQDTGGPGTHALTQSFTVPIDASTVTLTYDYYINNSLFEIINPIGLDHTGPPNQHCRIDILTAGAAPFSTSPVDVVHNILLSGQDVIPYSTGNVVDLTPFLTPGTTYQIRFGEVDNQFFLNFGLDNVSIIAGKTPIPTLSQWGILIFGLLIINLGIFFIQKKELVILS